MLNKKLPPILGIDNASDEFTLERQGKTPALYVRDAVNVDFTTSGNIKMRSGLALQTEEKYKHLWQSPLHSDCFASLGHAWIKVDPSSWEHEVILPNVILGKLRHIVLNRRVLMSCESGLYTYDGKQAQAFTLDTPASPMVSNAFTGGGLTEGDYSFAISWLIHDVESALSSIDHIQCVEWGSITIQFPLCLDERITHVRLYMTEPGGSELHQIEDYPISQLTVELNQVPQLGRVATNQFLSPMKHGDFLSLWRGRIVVAISNVLYFSEAMAYHLMDERYNFIQLPQKITFIEAVDGGLWVGQFDHVVFIRGEDLRQTVIEYKASAKPIPNSSFLATSEMVGSELSQGGSSTAVWLSEKGYTVGTATGQLVELQADHITNITGQTATAVGFANKIIAIVS